MRKVAQLSPTKLSNVPFFTRGRKSDEVNDYFRVLKDATPYLALQLWPVIFATFNILRVQQFNVDEEFSALQERLNKFWNSD